jgi:hypothetical protein
MKDEVESGVTLGASDALSSLKKQLSKEMSDIRYDEKSLQNIMKKNEPEFNIAVEKQRAERFKDEKPYVPGEGDPIGPLLDVTRNKRLEAMAKVNYGRMEDYGSGAVAGYNRTTQEDYDIYQQIASQPGEYQELAKLLIANTDQSGGPGFTAYKKFLAQPGFGGPANQYTYGQATTPADRYHLDRTGKIAEKGGVANMADGGKVEYDKSLPDIFEEDK